MRPLWELAWGSASCGLPDYPGADVSRTYVLPWPYVVYRGTCSRPTGTARARC